MLPTNHQGALADTEWAIKQQRCCGSMEDRGRDRIPPPPMVDLRQANHFVFFSRPRMGPHLCSVLTLQKGIKHLHIILPRLRVCNVEGNIQSFCLRANHHPWKEIPPKKPTVSRGWWEEEHEGMHFGVSILPSGKGRQKSELT